MAGCECCDNFSMIDGGDEFKAFPGLKGEDGTTYYPHVSADGILSWTNDGGKTNPDPVDISGPPGRSVEMRGPVASVSDLPTSAPSDELWLVGTASPYDGWFYNGTSWQNIGQISVGPPGPQGEQGEDGFSPTISTNEVSGGCFITITDATGTETVFLANGASAGFGTPTATVDANVGTPSVEVTATGPNTAKVFNFAFHNLKGEPGSGGGGPDPYTSDPADLAAAASPGSASQYSRGDHVHKRPTAAEIGAYVKPAGGIPASDLASGVIPSVPGASDATPAMDGPASPGSSGSWARGDHVHPADTNKQDKINASGLLKGDGSGGVSAAVAGTDYLTPGTAYSPVRLITATPYNISADDIGATVSCGYGMRNTPITVSLTQAVSTTLPIGTEIAILNYFDSDITITVSGIQVGVNGINGGGPTKLFYSSTSHSFKPKDIYSMLALKKISSDATYGDCWLLTGNVEVVT